MRKPKTSASLQGSFGSQRTHQDRQSADTLNAGGKRLPPLVCDHDAWMAELDSANLTDDQKRQLIESLWTTMVAFVDLRLKFGPKETCGQSIDLQAAMAAVMVDWKQHPNAEEDV